MIISKREVEDCKETEKKREEAIANHDDRALKQLVSDLKYRQAINYKNVRWHLKTGRAPLVTSEDKSKFEDARSENRKKAWEKVIARKNA